MEKIKKINNWQQLGSKRNRKERQTEEKGWRLPDSHQRRQTSRSTRRLCAQLLQRRKAEK